MRPTAIVEVRYTGVSMQPHSAIWIEPVSSPAPLRTAVPARIGVRTSPSSLPGTIAVTPVRATPRPSGGSGSSRRTVTCPTVTPSTSVTAATTVCSDQGQQGENDEQEAAEAVDSAATEVSQEAATEQADDQAGDDQGADDQSDEQGENQDCDG